MAKNSDLIKEKYNFAELREVVRRLRAPDGCPWDRAQTHESMENCMLEESAEVIQAVRNQDLENLCEELGDVLLQVLLHTDIAEEAGEFTFEDVVNGLAAKLVRRHPHVFNNGEEQAVSKPEEGLGRWEAVKAAEKAQKKSPQKNELERIPEVLPPVYRTRKVLKKVEKLYGADKISQKDVKELDFLIENCIDSEKALTKRLETFINDMK